jgi:hypothetical protein
VVEAAVLVSVLVSVTALVTALVSVLVSVTATNPVQSRVHDLIILALELSELRRLPSSLI